MEWNQRLVDELDLALNESQVCGLRFDATTAEARLLIEVRALPESGPIDQDPRRVLVFSGVQSVGVILRADSDELGPVLPLDSLDALEAFFASVGQADAMYGWSFIDVEGPGPEWSGSLSVSVTSRSPAADDHTLHWFTECGRPGTNDEWERFLLQGGIRFASLRVERADSEPVPLEQFVSDARRWWDAFQRRDARLSSQSQQQAQARAATWRIWGGTSVMVPGRHPELSLRAFAVLLSCWCAAGRTRCRFRGCGR